MCIRDSNAEYMGKPTSTTARITQYRLQRIRAMNLLRVLGFIVMIHACFSLLQYRNYKGDIDDLRKIPLDILVELLAGFVINMLFGVLKYGDLKSIKAARLGKNYENAFTRPNFNDYYRTRGGILTNHVKDVMRDLKLNSISKEQQAANPAFFFSLQNKYDPLLVKLHQRLFIDQHMYFPQRGHVASALVLWICIWKT
eukprot:TRINITY_DN7544_c0_g1_i1.p1 TRINITY_DN7544_c0_g1~~TRINITY_DN7544_c0_g1_i1.p1  ORF type:complete len:198 (+),score=37.25 TRINITY_DN7544_c0_g1_i1:64-657(+)